MSTEHPEQPAGSPLGDGGTPPVDEAGQSVGAVTGTADEQSPPSEAEVKANEEALARANETPEERQQRLDTERADQQKAAGQDPGADPLPLGKSGNAGAPLDVEVAGSSVQLTPEEAAVVRTLPTAATAVDSQGITRVVVPDMNASGWRPAPVEPDPVEVARLEKMTAVLEAQTAERATALGLGGQ